MTRLSRFPNYERAREPDTFARGELTKEVFVRDYVMKNRPLVVRGAASHWEALKSDSVNAFLEQYYPEAESFKCVLEPFGEYLGRWPGEARPDLSDGQTEFDREGFIEALRERPFVTAYAHPFTDALRRATGSLDFYDPDETARSTAYQSRCFIYRNGYTDWHFHGQDETITVQVLGDKELLLAPSDNASFRTFWRAVRRMPLWSLPKQDPEFEHVIPYRVLLRPGDCVFIPVFWWHAAEGSPGTAGVTSALVFPSPDHVQYNLRFAAARMYLWQALRHHPVAIGYGREFMKHMLPALRSTMFHRPEAPDA